MEETVQSTPQARIPTESPRPALRGLSRERMEALLAGAGFEAYRARQLYHWVYVRNAPSIDDMDNLPRALRQWLSEHARLGGGEMVRATGVAGETQKILLRLDDDRFIESVLMREGPGLPLSVCLSSQVGCPLGCTFCMTGFGGYQRNLAVDEIVGQLLALRRLLGPDETIQHVVFMGMGEPMLNLDAVIPAVHLIADPEGLKISRRRVTVSTVGVVPGIEEFGRARLGAGLAVSLNAATDEVRSQIMPINRKWPIARLLEACRRFPLEPRRRITFEYVLMKGVNDDPDNARRLARLLAGLPCKVNLIMFNPSPHLPYAPVTEETLDRFAAVLSDAQFTVTVRRSKGREIDAACGQLAAHHFEQTHA